MVNKLHAKRGIMQDKKENIVEIDLESNLQEISITRPSTSSEQSLIAAPSSKWPSTPFH